MLSLPRSLPFVVIMAVGGTASAQTQAVQKPEEPKLGTSDSAEVALVASTGNAQATSFAFRNLYGYQWAGAQLSWESGWLRVTSADDRYAVQVGSGYEVVNPGLTVDSQRGYSKLRYQRQISQRTDWFSNFDAVRDEPSNINSEYVVAGGLGTTWRKSDRSLFRTAYGVTYTDEDLVLEGANRFAGYRLFYGLKAPFGEKSWFESELTADGSFDKSDDFRTDWLNGLNVSINSKLALKASVRVLFRNLPALETLDLKTSEGAVVGTVEVSKKQLDTNFTTSLVITF